MKNILASLAAAFIGLTPIAAQAFPEKPIRLILPFGPGSATDFVSRALSDELGKVLGQPIIVENKAGGAGQVAATPFIALPPDGYTLFVGTSTTHSANPYLFKELSYDPIKDFTPIAFINGFTSVIAVNPKLPVSTVPELLEHAKANPGKLTFGYGNAISQIALSTLFQNSGAEVVPVPFKSNPEAALEVIAGRVDMTVVDLATSRHLLDGVQLRPIAGTRLNRSTVMPDLPAVSETPGFEGFNVHSWVGVFGPAGMSADIVDVLNKAIRKALDNESIKTRLAEVAAEASPDSPEHLRDYVAEQLELWGERVKAAGITAQ